MKTDDDKAPFRNREGMIDWADSLGNRRIVSTNHSWVPFVQTRPFIYRFFDY